MISKVATQGAKQLFSSLYVEKYTISYSTDRRKWTVYKGLSNRKVNDPLRVSPAIARLCVTSMFRKESTFTCVTFWMFFLFPPPPPLQTFTGNLNYHEVKENIFFPPLIGRFVRLIPTQSYNRPTVRLEYYGCELDGGLCARQEITLSLIFLYYELGFFKARESKSQPLWVNEKSKACSKWIGDVISGTACTVQCISIWTVTPLSVVLALCSCQLDWPNAKDMKFKYRRLRVMHISGHPYRNYYLPILEEPKQKRMCPCPNTTLSEHFIRYFFYLFFFRRIGLLLV